MRRPLLALLLLTCAGPAWGAITAVHKASIADSTDAISYSFTSQTLEANRLYLVFSTTSIASGTAPTVTSVASGAVTFVEMGTAGGTCFSACVRRIQAWRAMPASQQTSQTVTISWAATNSTAMLASLDEFDGVDTTGSSGSGAIVQIVTNTGGGSDANATSCSVTLAAFGDTDNRPYMAVHHRSAAEDTVADTTPSAYTELHDQTTATPTGSSLAEWLSSATDTTPSATWATTGRTGCWGVEIKDGGGGGPPATPPRKAIWMVDAVDACAGEPEVYIATIVEWGSILFGGYVPCPTAEDPDALCIVYDRPPFVEQARLYGAGEKSYDMPPDPDLMSVALLRVTTIDGAGHLDTEACP